MTTRLIVCLSWLALAVGACTHVSTTSRDDTGARRALTDAESLAAAGHYEEAAAGYARVAADYTGTRYAKEAAWSAALLYTSPLNTSPDDSAALHWLQAYRGYRLDGQERQAADACLFYLQRIMILKGELADKSADVASRSQHIKDLEAQLRDATEELKKMKEIDQKLHQRGGKK